jgi:hypothetical protein
MDGELIRLRTERRALWQRAIDFARGCGYRYFTPSEDAHYTELKSQLDELDAEIRRCMARSEHV